MSPLAQTQSGPGRTTLADMRDRARPLLIFASTPDDPQLELQLHLLQEHASEARERDLLPVALPYTGELATTEMRFSKAEADATRRRFHIAPEGFTVILLGKDGGEKLRSSQPLDWGKLMATIDAMPMRQEEVRGKAQHKR